MWLNSYRLMLVGIFLASVQAHGHVRYYTLNGKRYIGYLPVSKPDFNANAPSIARRINGDGPITNLTSREIACNRGANPIADNGISRVGLVDAGSDMIFDWGKGFPHEGPIMTYMARCDPDCGTFKGTEGKAWFKIDEFGYDGNMWATQKMVNDAGVWKSKVPECLEPGEYLVRHEIINNPSCNQPGKCQFYPSCIQVKVAGAGTVRPNALVGFPGAYGARDAGILWDAKNPLDERKFVVPGPRPFVCPS